MRKGKHWQFVVLLVAMGMLMGAVPVFAADATTKAMPWMAQGKGLMRAQGGMLQVIAEFLGLEPQQVVAQRQEGKSMVQIGESAGKTEKELVEKVVATRQDSLAQLVKENKITQEQADQCATDMEARITANLNRTTTGPAWAKGDQDNNRVRKNVKTKRGFGYQGGSASAR